MANELTWHDVLAEEKQQLYFFNTFQTVASERQFGVTIYLLQKDVFNAFCFTELGDVKVVIFGQDFYYGLGQAHGLAFFVCFGIAIFLLLLNMYKELENTILGFTCFNYGYFESWARQGVLLLNTVLTVCAGQAHFYASLGWETFTDKVISLINQHREGVVFLLWGLHAQKKGAIIDKQRHYVLKAPHLSPLSAHCGFFGCNYFVLANQWLEQHGETPIDWMPVLPAESE